MKFKSLVYSQASGSVGGLTYAHNAGGLYTRARAIPVNANTVQQQAVRNIVAALTAIWVGTLTAAQRAAWETYALNVPITDSLGDPRNIPGIAMYVRCNTPRIQGALARVDVAPTLFTMGSISPLVPTADVSAQTISTTYNNTDGWATAVGGGLLLYASRAENPSINYFKGPYRFYLMVPGAGTPPTSPAVNTSPFPFAILNKVFLQGRGSFPDGRLSSPFRIGCVVVA